MSDALLTIEGSLRNQTGKEYCAKLRREGKIPANLLEKGKSTPIEIQEKLVAKAYKGGRKFNLSLDGNVKAVKIQELQIHPVRRVALHLDLVYDA